MWILLLVFRSCDRLVEKELLIGSCYYKCGIVLFSRGGNGMMVRAFMLAKKVECRPVWKPMHKQPVYEGAPVYTNGVEEDLFKVGFCLPAGPYVSDDDVRYIVECIKEAIG